MNNDILGEMNAQELGAELKKAREKKKLTQQDAAEIIGVARTTITAIEKGDRNIRASELVQLARAYGKTVGDFVRRERPKSMPFEPQFRTAYRDLKVDELIDDEVVDQFEELCKDYVELENLTNNKLEYRYPPEYRVADNRVEQQAEVIALQERQRLGLGDGPLPVLRTLLESEVGLRVFYLKLKPSMYAGLYVYDAVMGGCIAINSDHPPGRRRWSLAHEYAHFLVDRHRVDMDRDNGYQRMPARERFADAFAKKFLMPVSGVGKQIGDREIRRTDLFQLANYFGVSVEAMTRRLEELQFIPHGTYDDLVQRGIKIRAVQKKLEIEPVLDPNQMLPERYKYLAINAIEDGVISEGRFARYIRASRAKAREIMLELEQLNAFDVDNMLIQLGDEDD